MKLQIDRITSPIGIITVVARAIGMANSLNPVAIVLPCHRVIGAKAKLTGYTGGLERKQTV